jgi:hypothetical protein
MNCPSTRDSWAVLMGGGSLPNVKLPDELAAAIPKMHPADDVVTAKNQWALANDDGDYLIYAENSGDLELAPHIDREKFNMQPVDVDRGKLLWLTRR